MNLKILTNNAKDIVQDIFYGTSRQGLNRLRSNRVFNNVRHLELAAIIADEEINLVLDVGANVGQFAVEIRRTGFKKQLISFEPIPEVYKQLEVKANSDSTWKTINCALGSEDKKQLFNVYSDSKLSSFLEGDGSNTSRFKNNFNESAQIEVDVRRLDSIWNELNVPTSTNNVFLKLDTQGYDLDVFKGIGEIKQNVKYILTELSIIPLYKNLPSYIEALEFYENEGYGPLAFVPVTRNHTDGRVIEFDCLLARIK